MLVRLGGSVTVAELLTSLMSYATPFFNPDS